MSQEREKENDNAAADQHPGRLGLTVNKTTNEIIFTDPTGQVFIVEPKVIESESERERHPLTVEEFKDALDQLEALGIRWMPRIPPVPVAEDASEWTTDSQKKYLEIQKKYPWFPAELGNVILHALLGRKMPA